MWTSLVDSVGTAIKRLIQGTAAIAACFILVSTASVSAAPLKIGGTGAALGGMTLLAEAFSERHPETEVEIVTGLGSTGGIKAVLAGAIDIGVAARGLRDKERAAGALAQAYARTPFVLATNADNQADGITLDRLAEVHRGETAKWPDGTTIRLVLRPKADSDTAMLTRLSPSLAEAIEAAHARKGLKIAATDQDSADAIESLPGALGTSTLALIRAERRAIKPLALDGVQPTAANVENGRYKLIKTFSIVTGQAPSPDAEHFVDFVRSPEGQRILLESGHVAIQGKLGS